VLGEEVVPAIECKGIAQKNEKLKGIARERALVIAILCDLVKKVKMELAVYGWEYSPCPPSTLDL
jgi:hypothetical protein